MPNEEYLNESLRKIAKGAGTSFIGTFIGMAPGYLSRMIIARFLGANLLKSEQINIDGSLIKLKIMKQRIVITGELIKEEEGGYTVYCPELDIYTQGEDIEDALNNLREAAELHIEEVGVENLKLKRVERKRIEMVI